MIHCQHQALLEDINACSPAYGSAAFWWIGQHSFVVKLGTMVLYFDPFLTDLGGRLVPTLLDAEEVTNANIVFGSHDHADHIDRAAWPVIAKKSPTAAFIVPELLRPMLSREMQIEATRFRGIDADETITCGDLSITAVAAAHELLAPDPTTGQHPTLGFIIQGNGLTIYHAGDTCIYEGLQTTLSKYAIDLAFLPINGRDAKRLKAGCIGNMSYQEAADLAGALTPEMTVPSHFEMFAGNTEDPKLFSDYMDVKYPTLNKLIPEHGKKSILRKRK